MAPEEHQARELARLIGEPPGIVGLDTQLRAIDRSLRVGEDLLRGIELPRTDALGIRAKLLAPRGVEELADSINRLALPRRHAAELTRGVGASAAWSLRLSETPAFDSLRRIMNRTADLSLQVQRRYAELVEAATPSLDTVRRYMDRWTTLTEGVVEFLRRQVDLQVNGFVVNHQWPLPITLDSALIGEAIALADERRRRVDAFMKQRFRPGTQASNAAWRRLYESPHFSRRHPLLRQARAAQRQGHWYLVINGLLPLVEGVLVDAAFPPGQRPQERRPKRAMDELRQQRAMFTYDLAVGVVEGIALSGAAGALFSRFDPADYGVPGEPSHLNRHAILHGAATRYGSERNALKLLLLLVVIAECFELRERAVRAAAAGGAGRRADATNKRALPAPARP